MSASVSRQKRKGMVDLYCGIFAVVCDVKYRWARQEKRSLLDYHNQEEIIAELGLLEDANKVVI